ncbi:tRNA (cytosine(38)-C(5))-methyltransferase-like isoform X2 [Gigantopelta aegis]|uniref:tRNA (cytosine(38)-C(5))-methyltransferase-like isoform X2 n=1 Tax=Gigantopelta aegis TaxID=1735272 RepID=UPI001B889179|nr:tRNA (cytosine(38)-C(5))-methyltransferase-like isoform X2 [Gigantopelta aegis]
MHCALQESGIQYTVVAAVDINTTANHIYHCNFPQTSLISCGIEKLTIEQMKKWRVDMILMSPPCQPFTRVGKKRDVDDIRAKSFLHVLQLVTKLDVKPRYILVENVKGFEQSQARQNLINTLQSCAYVFQEFLFTPLQFGIPNSRLRYYLVAKLSPLMFSFPLSQEIQTDLPVPSSSAEWLVHQDKGAQRSHYSSSNSARSQVQDTNICEKHKHSGSSSKSPEKTTVQSYMQSVDSTSSSARDIFVDDVTLCKTTDQPGCFCQDKNISCDTSCSQVATVDIANNATQSKEVCCSTKNYQVECDNLHQSDKVCCTTRNYSVKPSDSDLMVQNPSVISQKCNDISLCSEKHPNTNSHSCHCCGECSICSGVPDVKTYEDVKSEYENCGENLRLCGDGDHQQFSDCHKLEVFMEQLPREDLDKYVLGDKELKMFVIMDIVHSGLRRSSCFTRRYGHYMDGAGPIVQMSTDIQAINTASELKSRAVDSQNRQCWGEHELKIIRDLKLRYFTPREIANLLCFSPHFDLRRLYQHMQ